MVGVLLELLCQGDNLKYVYHHPTVCLPKELKRVRILKNVIKCIFSAADSVKGFALSPAGVW